MYSDSVRCSGSDWKKSFDWNYWRSCLSWNLRTASYLNSTRMTVTMPSSDSDSDC